MLVGKTPQEQPHPWRTAAAAFYSAQSRQDLDYTIFQQLEVSTINWSYFESERIVFALKMHHILAS